MKKRIIFFLPVFTLGGASESIFKLTKFLLKKKFSVLIISVGKNSYRNELKKIGADFHELKSSRALFSILKLRKIIRNELNKNFSKIVLVSSIHYANIIALISSYNLKGIKIVVTERSSLSELKIFTNLFSFLKNNLIFILAKYLYKYSDLVITNSLYEKNFIKNKFQVQNIKCIYPPSITGVINNNSFKNRLKNLKKIIYVGRLSKEKGVITILRALTNLKNINFIFNIYGDGDEKEKLKKFIKLNNLSKKVLFRGHIKEKKIIFKNASLFINASWFEGLPNALVQSINYGVFPICSNSPGGNIEVIKNGKLGLSFKTDDPLDLNKKISFFFQNYLKLNQRIRKIHLKNYIEGKSNKEYLVSLNKLK